ncbi:MAG: hypothetical protein WBA28_04980 [Microbacteriaceae bacterium]
MNQIWTLLFYTSLALLLLFAFLNLPYNGVFLIIILVAIVTAPTVFKQTNWKA